MASHHVNYPSHEVNPFANPSQYPSSRPSVVTFEAVSISYNYDRNPVIDINKLDKAANLKQKEGELQAMEAEIERREEEVKKKEEALARAGVFVDVRNWPPFCPIIHHDIANEIPMYLHRMLYVAFATFLGLVLCLFWNVLAAFIATIQGLKDGSTILLLAALYFIIGAPAAYILWYRPLYRACRKDSAVRFGCFFLFYMLHIALCIYALVAPPIIYRGLYVPGILSVLIVLPKHALTGIFYLIGFGLFCVETAVSIWVIQRVYRYFRSTG